jgi:hypothetical protein
VSSLSRNTDAAKDLRADSARIPRCDVDIGLCASCGGTAVDRCKHVAGWNIQGSVGQSGGNAGEVGHREYVSAPRRKVPAGYHRDWSGAVACLESVEVKTMLLGVAVTVIELLTAKVMDTAAALLVVWALD